MFDGNLTYFAIKFNYFWLGLGKQSWKERPKRAEGGEYFYDWAVWN